MRSARYRSKAMFGALRDLVTPCECILTAELFCFYGVAVVIYFSQRTISRCPTTWIQKDCPLL